MKPLHLHSSVLAVAVAAALVVTPAALAGTPSALPAPWHPAHALTPKDVPYAGLLRVNIDLTHAPKQHIFYVHETIPVEPGPFTFYYPKWIPGEHMPSGPVNNVVGMVVKANGHRLHWQRDTLDMYTFHVNVPKGATQLNVSFQFVSPFHGGEFGAGVSVTPNIVDLEFNQVAFYPAGYYSRDVRIKPTVELPKGWKFASALRVQSRKGNTIEFQPVTFNNFVDSPLISGKYFTRVDLTPGAKVSVHLNVVGDSAKDVVVSNKRVKKFRSLVKQATALFGSHHYHHYDFLLTVSDHTDHFGLEHHQSSDDRVGADYFTSKWAFKFGATLLPHEYTHSWNGKFRRPAQLWTPNFNVPMQDNLLWVYEGLTSYYAGVLATRAGLWTPKDYHFAIQHIAVSMAHRPGREWRSLQDTATAAPLTYTYGGPYRGWHRGTDFYSEGKLLWMSVDAKIRQLSDNKKSLDDFAKLFYGVDNGSYVTQTYTFQELVDALNKVQPWDWTKFLRSRLDYTGKGLPEHALKLAGWKIIYNTTPPKGPKLPPKMAKYFGGGAVARAVGFNASSDGKIWGVTWNGPAFKAGLAPGMTIAAVGDGKTYSRDALKTALKAAHKNHKPLTVLVKFNDHYNQVEIPDTGKLEYPHLVRIKGSTNYLKDILTPLK